MRSPEFERIFSPDQSVVEQSSTKKMFHNISYANPVAARGRLTTIEFDGYRVAPSAFLSMSFFFMSLQA